MEHKLTGSFASFQIQQFATSGSISDIYLARDDRRHAVALKVLKSAYVSDAAYARRLFLEGEILNSIQKSQPDAPIPHCLQMGRESKTGNPFLALEFIEGQSLRSLLNAGRRFTVSDILSVGKSVCVALEAVHQSGFCHHGVSADNILVQSHDTRLSGVTLIGFGMACLENMQSDVAAGNPLTMSPEECRNEPVTYASDLYSLGVVLYEMTVGHPPFTSRTDNPTEIMEQHRFAEPRIPPGVEEPLRSIILALLSKDPSHRLDSAAQLRALPAESADVSSPFSGSPAIYPLTSNDASANRLGWEMSDSATLERLLSPAEVYISEPEKLVKQPLEERLDFPLHQIPEIPILGEAVPRTPSQDSRRKEPSDDDLQVREVFPSETLLREAAKDDVPLDELGLPSIDVGLIKELPFREPSDRDRDSERQSVRREERKEELSSFQEALVGPGAIQDLDKQSKTVTPPPVTPPVPPVTPPARKSRRGMALIAALIGILGLLSTGGFFLFFKPHPIGPTGGTGGTGGFPPPTTKKVKVCKDSHMLPGPYCPPDSIQEEEFVIGKEPKEVCTFHHKLVPPPQKVPVRICTVSGKVANEYCPKDKIKVEEFTKGEEPKEVCKVHHKSPPPPQWVTVHICTVSHRLPNRYCPPGVIATERFIKGKQPTAHCTIHHKPEPVLVPIAKKCPVGGEPYPLSAIYCNNAAHKVNGKYPRLIVVKGPKR